MNYRVSNGIMSAVLTEAEARAHYDAARFVRGEFGGRFVICPVGEFGRILSIAATTYTPIPQEEPDYSENSSPSAEDAT